MPPRSNGSGSVLHLDIWLRRSRCSTCLSAPLSAPLDSGVGSAIAVEGRDVPRRLADGLTRDNNSRVLLRVIAWCLHAALYRNFYGVFQVVPRAAMFINGEAMGKTHQ